MIRRVSQDRKSFTLQTAEGGPGDCTQNRYRSVEKTGEKEFEICISCKQIEERVGVVENYLRWWGWGGWGWLLLLPPALDKINQFYKLKNILYSFWNCAEIKEFGVSKRFEMTSLLRWSIRIYFRIRWGWASQREATTKTRGTDHQWEDKHLNIGYRGGRGDGGSGCRGQTPVFGRLPWCGRQHMWLLFARRWLLTPRWTPSIKRWASHRDDDHAPLSQNARTSHQAATKEPRVPLLSVSITGPRVQDTHTGLKTKVKILLLWSQFTKLTSPKAFYGSLFHRK